MVRATAVSRTLCVAVLLAAVALCSGVVVCDTAPTPVIPGTSRWPRPNPALVAPVTATFNYPAYSHPLSATFTGSSFTIAVPPDFVAGFNLTNSAGDATERYLLTTLDVRLPGLVPDGLAQVPNHVLELSLLHKEATGKKYWANVVIPIEVTSDPRSDPLTPLFASATMPKVAKETMNVLVDGTVSLDLSAVWSGSPFSTYWTSLPTDCAEYQAGTRQIMRGTALATVQNTFSRLMDALSKSLKTAAAAPPAVTYLLGTCAASDTCSELQAESLAPKLEQALDAQSAAVARLRASKDEMDQALIMLRNTSESAYDLAVESRSNLRLAESSLASAKSSATELQAWVNDSQTQRWDSAAPSNESLSFEIKAAVVVAAEDPVKSLDDDVVPSAVNASSNNHSASLADAGVGGDAENTIATDQGKPMVAFLHQASASMRGRRTRTVYRGMHPRHALLTSQLLERAARDGARHQGGQAHVATAD